MSHGIGSAASTIERIAYISQGRDPFGSKVWNLAIFAIGGLVSLVLLIVPLRLLVFVFTSLPVLLFALSGSGKSQAKKVDDAKPPSENAKKVKRMIKMLKRVWTRVPDRTMIEHRHSMEHMNKSIAVQAEL